jgi:dihydrolipoamide dehydrogenase
MQREFMARGITVDTRIGGIDRVEPLSDGLRLVYRKDDREHVVETDAVIVAVGWVGNTEDLGLDAAGVATQRGYVVVNDALQTSAPHIFAAGDITGRMMLVQSATSEGIIAAENAVLGSPQSLAHEIVPHGGFTDPEYGSVGLTEAQARQKGKYVSATVLYAELDRAVIDNHPAGFCKLIVAPRTRRILGAHVVGEQALEVTQMVAAAMAANARISDLARMEIAYPTYSAIVGLAARRVVHELGIEATRSGWSELGPVRDVEWERKAE